MDRRLDQKRHNLQGDDVNRRHDISRMDGITMTTDKEHLQWIYDRLATVHLESLSWDHMRRLKQIIDAPDDQAAMLDAFRHAANSIGVEAGVHATHKPHGGMSGDHYFLELISEAELRFRKLSVKYERLRAAAIGVSDTGDNVTASQKLIAMAELKEALNDDR